MATDSEPANFTFHDDVESNIPTDVVKSWHPKISPYRLWVLATTIGFGTAKSISAQTGNAYIPTTLEWIAGTVIFLIFFSVSSYDTDDKPTPKCLSWLFEPDCSDALWFLLERALSIKRPTYSSKEAGHPSRPKSHHPALSHYRLLVGLTVTSFGLSKAKLAYCGQSAAMNWTDWALAVPVTTILYVLGLYEYNDSHLWSSFFVADRKFGLSVGIKSSLGIMVSVAWAIGSLFALHYTLKHPEWVAEHPNTKPPASSTTRAYIDLMFYHSIRLFSYGMLLGQVVLGFTLLTLILNFFTESMEIDGNPVLSVWRRARRVLVRKAAPVVRSLSFEKMIWGYSGPRFERGRRILRTVNFFFRTAAKILFHVLAHLAMLAGCLLILGILFGMFTALLDARSQIRDFWNLILTSIVLLPMAGAVLCFIAMAVGVVYLLFCGWR